MTAIPELAAMVVDRLKQSDRKVVFAESCTGGLVAGALTQIPGVSAFHCGGFVVYRNETKQQYLDIPADILRDPGPVSSEVATLMCQGVLRKTPEADISAAVTGHLGPQAPAPLDGLIYIGVAKRSSDSMESQVKEVRLSDQLDRGQRQQQAIHEVLQFLADHLKAAPASD